MALKDQITADEIAERIPENLRPDDLVDAIIEAYRDQVCGYLEDVLGTSFGPTSEYLNSAKYWAINQAAILAMLYSSTDPDSNISFSPDGELKVSLTSLAKTTAKFIETLQRLSADTLSFLKIKLTSDDDLPVSMESIIEREG